MAYTDDSEDRIGPRETGFSPASPALVRPGSLLVAATDLTEPSFRRTVIYMIEHNDSGSLGVVLNRPSDTPVHAVLPTWSQLVARPRKLFVGGPVKRDAALCLATLRDGSSINRAPGMRRVAGRVAMVDLDSDPWLIARAVQGVRIFAGYSGWSRGQLDNELRRNDWMVFSALPSDVLGPPTHRGEENSRRPDVWAQVLRRQPLPIALLASHPVEIERN